MSGRNQFEEVTYDQDIVRHFPQQIISRPNEDYGTIEPVLFYGLLQFFPLTKALNGRYQFRGPMVNPEFTSWAVTKSTRQLGPKPPNLSSNLVEL